LMASPLVLADSYPFQNPSAAKGQADEQALTGLAKRVLADYQQPDQSQADAQRFRLQLMAGRYAEAEQTLISLQQRSRAAQNISGEATAIFYRVYARACREASERHESFEQIFPQAFREVFQTLDDLGAAYSAGNFGSLNDPYGPSIADAQKDLQQALAHQQGKTEIDQADALDLIGKYLAAQALQRMQPSSGGLIDEDDHRRYEMADVLVATPDAAHINAVIVRPRSAKPLPTLLGFTVYANPLWTMAEARLTAAHNYAAVVAYTRGMGNSPDQQVPYEHDGADADAVIEWISHQPWSDGRVGMYGGSYNGFTQWAAAKHLPPALKAMMPSVTAAPGIDVPMEGNVFLNFVYSWVPYITRDKHLDQTYYDDQAHWDGLNHRWYTSGKAYRELDRIDGTPNPVFDRWLDHPAYDAYWQAMIPYKQEFAAINIPVLTTTGYYDGGQIGALYYFMQHYLYNPKAEHYLLIGPYNHIGAQRSAWSTLSGYTIDPVANINISKVLRYQWFDYILRHGPKPALLVDRVNYQVMGANEWKHAPSLAAMSNAKLRLYLDAARPGGDYRLSENTPKEFTGALLQVDLTDRSDVDAAVPEQILDKAIDRRNALVFVGEPLAQATEFSGLFSGQLDFELNKKDVDISIALYEQLPDGRYFQLSWYLARASYMKDRSHRELLVPGRQQINFQNGRLTSRLLQPGSRLVAVIGVVKQPNRQINYGSGKDVSEETIVDGKEPIKIRWLSGSYLDIPISR
jgi:putative CocE/NonD family hydrolase